MTSHEYFAATSARPARPMVRNRSGSPRSSTSAAAIASSSAGTVTPQPASSTSGKLQPGDSITAVRAASASSTAIEKPSPTDGSENRFARAGMSAFSSPVSIPGKSTRLVTPFVATRVFHAASSRHSSGPAMTRTARGCRRQLRAKAASSFSAPFVGCSRPMNRTTGAVGSMLQRRWTRSPAPGRSSGSVTPFGTTSTGVCTPRARNAICSASVRPTRIVARRMIGRSTRSM